MVKLHDEVQTLEYERELKNIIVVEFEDFTQNPRNLFL